MGRASSREERSLWCGEEKHKSSFDWGVNGFCGWLQLPGFILYIHTCKIVPSGCSKGVGTTWQLILKPYQYLRRLGEGFFSVSLTCAVFTIGRGLTSLRVTRSVGCFLHMSANGGSKSCLLAVCGRVCCEVPV